MKVFAFLLLASISAFAQTAALAPSPQFYGFSANGAPLAGGQLFTYVAGTTTPQATYTTSAGNVANSNPVILNTSGFASVWLTCGASYHLVLEDSAGNVQYSQDNVVGACTGNGSTINLALVNFNPNFTGTSNTSLQNFLTAQVIDMQSFSGFGTTNTDNAPQFNAAIAIAGINNVPAVIVVPPGQYLVCSSVVLDQTNVRLVGSGWGNPSEFSTPTIGTVIKACPTFNSTNTGANFYKNYVLAINCTTDCYDVRAEQMTVDGAGLADALYVGHANEQSGYSYITADNFIHTGGGLYLCGAGNGPTNASAICGAINGGDQGDGPYENLQFYPQTNATANSIPIMMVGVLSLKNAGNWTISGTGAATQPSAAGYIGGNEVHLHDIHMEGLQTGFKVGGGTSQLCPNSAVCNGMIGLTTQNVDLTASSSTSSHTFELYDCQQCNLNYTSDQASGGFGIYTDFISTPITSTDANVSWLSTRASGGNYWVLSSDPSWDFHLSNNNVILDHNLELYNDDAFQLLFKSKTGSQYYQKLHLDTAGDMHVFNMSNGTGNWSFENPYAFLSMIGNTGAETDLFLQAPLDTGNNYIRTMLGSQIYWSHANQNWTLANGTLDYAAFYFPNGGGTCMSTQPSTSGGTLTNTAFLNNTYWCTYPNNHTILGPDVPGATDNGSTLQVLGNVSTTGAWNQGNSRMLHSSSTTCPTSNTAGSTCTFTFNVSPSFSSAPANASCSLIAPSGSPQIQGVTTLTASSVVLTISNGQGSQAVASGAGGASCWVTP